MKQTRHPWTTTRVKECVYTVTDADGNLVAMIRDLDDKEDRVKSISALVTASPELLTLARNALAVLLVGGTEPTDPKLKQLVTDLKFAISKAEGRE
jgi:hypothetical protein